MAKPVDARDLKSLGPRPCGFDPRRPHQRIERPLGLSRSVASGASGLASRLVGPLEKGLGAIGGLAIAILTDIAILRVLRANKGRLPRAIRGMKARVGVSGRKNGSIIPGDVVLGLGARHFERREVGPLARVRAASKATLAECVKRRSRASVRKREARETFSVKGVIAAGFISCSGDARALPATATPRFASACPRPVEFQAVRQHDDRLRAALAFIHRKPDRLSPVCEQAAAQAPCVLDHPVTGSIPPDEEARQACGGSRLDVLLNHDVTLVGREGLEIFLAAGRRLKSSSAAGRGVRPGTRPRGRSRG